jgi:hypothetical protein
LIALERPLALIALRAIGIQGTGAQAASPTIAVSNLACLGAKLVSRRNLEYRRIEDLASQLSLKVNADDVV